MPRRRRNPDGSLVVPLSELQLANLAKGRERLLAKQQRQGSPVVAKASGRSRVRVAKASAGQPSRVAKASAGQQRAKRPATPPPAKATAEVRQSRVERWLRGD